MINYNFKKIFICSTEQSGDNIGSGLIKELLKINPNLTFDGVGGSKMSPYFQNKFYDIGDFKSMGIIEIFFSLRKYIKMIKILSKIIIKNNYDLIITIDSPDFNYPLVKKIRKYKYLKNAIHIVAPTVWAWRKNRAIKFANIYNEILVLFKFEKKFFEKYNLKSTFIGHPIYYINQNVNKIGNNFNEDNYISFLPGSRENEVKKLFKFFNLAHDQLLIYKPNINIFIPTLPHLKNTILYHVKKWKIKTFVLTEQPEIEKYFSKTKYSLTCSGTAALEISKRNIPQLVIYKLNFITEFIVKFFIKVRFANLMNIIENKKIIPELVNSQLNNLSFIKAFKILILNDELNNKQVNEINKSIINFECENPPYEIAADRVIDNL